MAICPSCRSQGELCNECPTCHRYFVEESQWRKAPNDELLGTLIGSQYIPIALIGEGGMGRIYKARAKYTGQTVALKILKSEYMEDETLKDRFFREAEVVGALDHPHIVKLYGCAPVPEHNTIYMAMELLNGRTLFEVLRQEVPPLQTMIRWFTEIASALGCAHAKGIFHRDLKPENVFIIQDEDGSEHVKVLDFGFARLQGAAKKLTMAGVAFGTPHYMSPEQAMGLTEITAACDVYALGIMLFQAISGNVPYNSATNSPMEVMHAQVNSPTPQCTPRPEYDVPKSLISCVYKCMKKEPKDRYADGNELCVELQTILETIKKADEALEMPTIVSHAVNASATTVKASASPISQTTILIVGAALVLAALVAVIVFVLVL